jgi:hypothetical protein
VSPEHSGASLGRYLKAAFWRSPLVPGLGRVPLNAAGVIGVLILGFGHPAIWLLGAAAEAAYLVLLATSPRFQKLVAVQARKDLSEAGEERQRRLLGSLAQAARQRLQRLDERCARLTERAAAGEAVAVAENVDALARLRWTFLKLLVAQDHLQSVDVSADASRLEAEIRQIEASLARPNLPATIRSSKQATERILQRRLENVSRRARDLEQIESDLTRIEQQVELALEQTALRGEPAIVSADVDLASELLEDSFGSASGDVAALEERYRAPDAARPPGRLRH